MQRLQRLRWKSAPATANKSRRAEQSGMTEGSCRAVWVGRIAAGMKRQRFANHLNWVNSTFSRVGPMMVKNFTPFS